MESKNERKVRLDQWLKMVCPDGITECEPLPADASTRQYYRVITSANSYVAMDSPPPQDNQPFVSIASALSDMGLDVPEVLAKEMDSGFLLLTDFGDLTYLRFLAANYNASTADDLYGRALRALSVMQSCRHVPDYTLPVFGLEWMEREWSWHQEWFLQKWLGLDLPVDAAVHQDYEKIIVNALEQPQVFMHRDYHSANLMVLPEGRVGILDFQDAFIGPLTYDLASLLRDCYIEWRPAMVEEWAGYYFSLLRAQGLLSHVSTQTFVQWFDWMGIQRHIKALMTFARKYVRDEDARYLVHVPRTVNAIIKVSEQYPVLRELTHYYANIVEPAVRDMKIVCEP